MVVVISETIALTDTAAKYSLSRKLPCSSSFAITSQHFVSPLTTSPPSVVCWIENALEYCVESSPKDFAQIKLPLASNLTINKKSWEYPKFFPATRNPALVVCWIEKCKAGIISSIITRWDLQSLCPG